MTNPDAILIEFEAPWVVERTTFTDGNSAISPWWTGNAKEQGSMSSRDQDQECRQVDIALVKEGKAISV